MTSNQPTMKPQGTQPKLSAEQRETLLGWITAGTDDFRGLRQLMDEAGFPRINRQAVHHYVRRFAKQKPCPACGLVSPRRLALKGQR